MVDYLARPTVHEAFFKKYASKKFIKGAYSSLPLRLSLLFLTRPSFYPHAPVGQEERLPLQPRRL